MCRWLILKPFWASWYPLTCTSSESHVFAFIDKHGVHGQPVGVCTSWMWNNPRNGNFHGEGKIRGCKYCWTMYSYLIIYSHSSSSETHWVKNSACNSVFQVRFFNFPRYWHNNLRVTTCVKKSFFTNKKIERAANRELLLFFFFAFYFVAISCH